MRLRAPVKHLLPLILIAACGGGKGFQKPTTGQAKDVTAESEDVSTIPASPVVVYENSPLPPQTSNVVSDAEPQERQPIAVEPVSVGGAYLTCVNPSQVQEQPEWFIDCHLSGGTNLDKGRLVASFSKIDSAGKAFPLTIVSYTAATQTWRLSELVDTVFIKAIEATITVDTQNPVVLQTQLTQPFNFAINPLAFMVNEPSNLATSGGTGEDCIEVMNDAEKQKLTLYYNMASPAFARFNDNDCNASRRFLCRQVGATTGAKFIISPSAGPFSAGATACPAGYQFSAPLTNAEHTQVANLVVATVPGTVNLFTIWVALSDSAKEGTFQIILK